MKKINIFITLGVFVLLLIGLTQSAYADAWNYRNDPSRVNSFDCCTNEAAQLNAATSKFEGLLNAYSANQNPKVEKQTLAAVDDLSSSLEEFNTALMEVYPTLSEEEQLAVQETYSSLGLYLEDLVVETNSVFGRKVFQIEYIHIKDKIISIINAISL